MDLFAAQPAAAEVLVAPAADTAANELTIGTIEAQQEEAPAPSIAPVAEKTEQTEQGPTSAADESPAEPKPAPKPKEEPRARPLPAPPPVNPAQLRKAVNQILPLFTGQDPGARDCLKDNRATFRSAFSPEGYAEFEQSVKKGDFDAALEHLKKAAKRHGISV